MTNTIKTVDELREALEAVKTAEQAEAALNSTTIQTLKKYVKEEDYYFGKPIFMKNIEIQLKQFLLLAGFLFYNMLRGKDNVL